MTDTSLPPALDTQARSTHLPGWPEFFVGLTVMVFIGYLGTIAIQGLGLGRVTTGLILTAYTGIAGLSAFAAAALLRLRSWSGFGARLTTRRWLLIGIVVGFGAFMAKGIDIIAFTALTGMTSNPQDIYAVGGSGGLVSLVPATLFRSVLSRLGEEFLYRGIETNAFLRYGWFAGVVGRTVIFALMHGINIVLPAAAPSGRASNSVPRVQNDNEQDKQKDRMDE